RSSATSAARPCGSPPGPPPSPPTNPSISATSNSAIPRKNRSRRHILGVVQNRTAARSFESRVWQRALDRGLLSAGQVNACLKENDQDAPTLCLTEVLVSKGFLLPDQVRALRGELVLAEPEAP